MTELKPVMAVREIHKSFGSGDETKRVLRGLSFEVGENQVVSLLGANGAGKTTLVNIASTLMLPSQGTIEICGHDVAKEPEKVREAISLTGQFAAVDGELTGRENLVFFARLHGLRRAAARKRADELLEEFRLTDAAEKLVGKYSGGMRRRLDIAASLVVKPKLLFLDEPTTGLDPLSRRELWQTIEQLRSSGVAVLLTTQYLDEAERLSDDIVLIRDGVIALQGPPAALRQQFGASVCTLGFVTEADARKAAEVLPSVLELAQEEISVQGASLTYTAANKADDLAASLAALRQADLEVSTATLAPPSLDDVFLGMAFQSDQEPTDEQ